MTGVRPWARTISGESLMTVGSMQEYGQEQKLLWRNGARTQACCKEAVLENVKSPERWEETLDRLDNPRIRVDTTVYASLLRRCADARILQMGKRLHAIIVKVGQERERLLGNLLVEMYGKCGSLEDARDVFDKIDQRNVFSWTIVIAAYVQCGKGKAAFGLFQQMQQEGVTPNKVTFISILSVCAAQANLAEGKRMHAQIVASRLELDVAVGNALVNMYGKCGSAEDAQRMFDKMPARNVVSWNSIIAAYAQHGRSEEALQLFRRMHLERLTPNKVTFISVLQSCAGSTALAEGKQIHARIVASRVEVDLVMANALINMYGKCGSLEDACKVFDEMGERDVFSWTAMISACARRGNSKDTLQIFQQMQLDGFIPNKVTFLSIISVCASQAALPEGKWVHSCIVGSEFELDVVVGNALVNMYGKCGSVGDAWRTFNKIRQRNVVSWNAMIAAYAQQGHGKEAFQVFQQMQLEGVIPDKVTFVSVLSACACQAALAEGKRLHALIVGCGFELDVVVGNALVNMYGKSGSLEDARMTFEKMPKRDVISWTAIIAACAQHGHAKESLRLFQQMQLGGYIPNKVTFVSIISACAFQTALAEGKWMHSYIIGCGFELDIVVGNALINMYSKCGSLKDAWRTFDKMPERNVVSWTAMIAACAQLGNGKEAFLLFQEMQLKGVIPNKITFVNLLSACASQGALTEGKRIHAFVVDSRFEADVAVGNALVNMYGRCGSLEDAWRIFDKMPEQDAISWTAMIAAFSQHGHGKEALELFQQMQLGGMIPTNVTFISILSACSHSGLVDEGCRFFVSLSQDHGIITSVEHYNCIIDLLGRAGWLDEGEFLISKMPYEQTAMAWMTLLGACRTHFDVQRGKRAAEHVFVLDPGNASPYVLLSNIYAAAGMWDDAEKVRKLLKDKGLKKQPGHSLIEVKNKVHEFFAGDELHPQKEEIFAELQRVSRQMEEGGYVPDTSEVLYDVEEEEKEHLVFHHSEKLAIAFGLISTPAETPLRITKNLRVCPDCHTATKFISKIYHRDIFVRDANRFHHFKDGTCSCADYW